jgi:hypothetical protein
LRVGGILSAWMGYVDMGVMGLKRGAWVRSSLVDLEEAVAGLQVRGLGFRV